MRINKEPEKLSDLLGRKSKKPPAYQWQDLALKIIERLDIPDFKRNSIFKVCKDNPKNLIEKCLIDTLELCQTGNKWRYFFKLIGDKKTLKSKNNNL